MNTKEFIVLRLELTDTPIEVWREIAIPTTNTLFELKGLLCALFNFDEEAQYSFDVDGELIDNQQAKNAQVGMFMTGAESSVIFSSHGTDTWNVIITPEEILEESTNQFPVTCMAGEGQAILNKDMTHEMYTEIVESALLGNQDFSEITDLSLEFVGEDLFDIDVNEINTEILNTYEFREKDEDIFEDSLVTEEKMLNAPLDEIVYDESDLVPNQEGRLSEDFFNQEVIVQFYTDVIGLTEEQAAYHVLYETSINNIIDAMHVEGYSEQEIEQMMKGNHALDEELYEKLSSDFDILHALPSRDEIFSEEDEKRLTQVEQALFSTLEENNLTFESFVHLTEEEANRVEELFMDAIRNIDNNLLS